MEGGQAGNLKFEVADSNLNNFRINFTILNLKGRFKILTFEIYKNYF